MGVFRLSFYKWLIVGCLTFSAKYFLHNQDENKLTNTYMNYTKLRGEWYNQDENKLTNTYMNYTKIRGEWYNQDENKLTNTYMNYTIIIIFISQTDSA
jgi:hypothetical protein